MYTFKLIVKIAISTVKLALFAFLNNCKEIKHVNNNKAKKTVQPPKCRYQIHMEVNRLLILNISCKLSITFTASLVYAMHCESSKLTQRIKVSDTINIKYIVTTDKRHKA